MSKKFRHAPFQISDFFGSVSFSISVMGVLGIFIVQCSNRFGAFSYIVLSFTMRMYFPEYFRKFFPKLKTLWNGVYNPIFFADVMMRRISVFRFACAISSSLHLQ